jgi:hypothetical protein
MRRFQPAVFFRTVKTEIALPPEAGKNVIKLFSANQSVIAVTKNGVFRYRNGNWSGKSNGSDWRTATVDKQGKVWLASAKTLFNRKTPKKNSPCLNLQKTTPFYVCFGKMKKRCMWVQPAVCLPGMANGIFSLK